MTPGAFAAVDLGASSGRVMIAEVSPKSLELTELHRFANAPINLPDGLHWDIVRLYQEILAGLALAARLPGELRGVAIDSWGVDYGLLDEQGALLGNPYHYRDERSLAAVAEVHRILSPEVLYARTGTQVLALDTIYQLAAERSSARLLLARNLVLIPDLLGYWLTGVITTETTNASTTGLLDAQSRSWAADLLSQLGLPAGIFLAPQAAGAVLGGLRPAVQAETGIRPGTELSLVGSHDTASAVVGIPAVDERFAYIACGTWSLVGVELEQPVLTEASRAANFTNEVGVDGRVRYLRNVMGLWLLQESIRAWQREGYPADLAGLIEAAAAVPDGGPVFDPDGPEFIVPGDMPGRIAEACLASGQPVPGSRPEMVRCILESLAAAYARALDDAVRLSGRAVDVVHLVGGGARNALLCRLTADACQRPVVAGPVEATAIGNVLVQARTAGVLSGDLESLRGLVRATQPSRRYEPRASPARPGRPAR
ncbi:MAG: rhamnulokinase family protein [Candidatus Limnocylindrales bacterium]